MRQSAGARTVLATIGARPLPEHGVAWNAISAPQRRELIRQYQKLCNADENRLFRSQSPRVQDRIGEVYRARAARGLS